MNINDILIDSITYKRDTLSFLGRGKKEFITGVHVSVTYKSISITGDIATSEELTPTQIKEQIIKILTKDSEE